MIKGQMKKSNTKCSAGGSNEPLKFAAQISPFMTLYRRIWTGLQCTAVTRWPVPC